MCKEIDKPKEVIKDAKAYWSKGNEPEAMWFKVEARLCNCGETYWARTQHGYWVECSRE